MFAACAKLHKPMNKRRSDEQLSVILPAYVVDQIKDRGRQEREPLRVIVLKALEAAGYRIDKGDVVDRRREAARIRSELYRQYRERR